MRFFKCLTAGLICSTAIAAVATAGVGKTIREAGAIGGTTIPPISLNSIGRAEAGALTQDLAGSGGANPDCTNVWWNNGAFDNVDGLNSQEIAAAGFSALTADDMFLQFGKCYFFDQICLDLAYFAVPTSNPATVVLRIYDDCNGKPSTLAFPEFSSPTITDLGAIPTWPGYKRIRCCFKINRFEYGYRRLWLVPVGIGQGLYYWLTSGNGVVQGVQGQYKSANYGYPNWTDVESIVNFRHCTDFNFKVCGKCCWLLKDNSDFDLNGLDSISFPGVITFGSRAVDNFQVPPGDPVEICRICAWFATNCDITRAFMEIYDNQCDSPVVPRAGLIENLVTEQLFNAAGAPITYAGLPVYKFTVTCPGIVLTGGRNYWLGVATLGGGTPHERGVWLFKRKSTCHINITEGQYRSDFFGYPSFTPVSDPGLAGEPRDFAFQVYIARRDVVTTPPPVSNTAPPAGLFQDTWDESATALSAN